MSEEIPDYRKAETGGSMIRAACWLASEVGEGTVFTKEALREAIPNVSQIDRRVRDLRDFGWVIDNNLSVQSLAPNEQRLTKIGVRVWIEEERRAAQRHPISDRVRQAVFNRDKHACVRCGIAAGEEFPDDPGTTARLTAAHVYPGSLGSDATEADLVTACQRCNESLQQQTPTYLDDSQVQVRIQSLGWSDRRRLLKRMQSGRREWDDVDRVWADYCQLPAVAREKLEEQLFNSIENQ